MLEAKYKWNAKLKFYNKNLKFFAKYGYLMQGTFDLTVILSNWPEHLTLLPCVFFVITLSTVPLFVIGS